MCLVLKHKSIPRFSQGATNEENPNKHIIFINESMIVLFDFFKPF